MKELMSEVNPAVYRETTCEEIVLPKASMGTCNENILTSFWKCLQKHCTCNKIEPQQVLFMTTKV